MVRLRILESGSDRAYNFAEGFRCYDAVMNERCLIGRAVEAETDFFSKKESHSPLSRLAMGRKRTLWT